MPDTTSTQDWIDLVGDGVWTAGAGASAPTGGPSVWGGPRRRARRGELRDALLMLLAERPRTGYELINEVGGRTQGFWRPSPGSVYPLLQQLTDEGLVTLVGEDGRRVYRLTEQGERVAAERPADAGAPWENATAAVDERVLRIHRLVGEIGAAAAQVIGTGAGNHLDGAVEALGDVRRRLYLMLAEDGTDRPGPDSRPSPGVPG